MIRRCNSFGGSYIRNYCGTRSNAWSMSVSKTKSFSGSFWSWSSFGSTAGGRARGGPKHWSYGLLWANSLWDSRMKIKNRQTAN